jgi:hypothetical protein
MVLAVPTAEGVQYAEYPNGLTTVCFRNMVVQGGEAPTGQKANLSLGSKGTENGLAALYSGESTPSLRSLLHRTYFVRSLEIGTALAHNFIYKIFPRFPVPYHSTFDDTYEQFTPANGGGLTDANLCNTTPIAYLTACFVGYRGAINWNVTNTEAYTGRGLYNMIMTRAEIGRAAVGLVRQDITNNSNFVNNALWRLSIGCGLPGATSSCQSNNGTVSAIFPSYSNLRMHPANMAHPYNDVINPSTFNAITQYNTDGVAIAGINSSGGNTSLLFSVSAAHDYTPLHFLNVPDIYLGSIAGS